MLDKSLWDFRVTWKDIRQNMCFPELFGMFLVCYCISITLKHFSSKQKFVVFLNLVHDFATQTLG